MQDSGGQACFADAVRKIYHGTFLLCTKFELEFDFSMKSVIKFEEHIAERDRCKSRVSV